MIAAKLADWRQHFTGPVWTKAFEFLEQLPTDSPDNDGLVSIDGDTLLYRVMSYPTRGPEGTTVEAHETYIDIQMSLEGAEAIDWFSRDGLSLHKAYDAENDYLLFDRPDHVTAPVIFRSFIPMMDIPPSSWLVIARHPSERSSSRSYSPQ